MIIIDYLYPKFRKYNRYRKSPDGKTHYKWTIFNSYVSLPEGKSPDWLSLICHLVIYLPLMIIIDYLYPKFRKYNRYRKSPDGKTHYKWTIFNSYVSLPEGKSPDWLSLICHLVIYLPLMIIIDYLYPKFRKYNRYRKSPDGKTHYKWTIFNSYVSLPEGKSPDWLSLIYHLVIYLPLMIIIDDLYPKFRKYNRYRKSPDGKTHYKWTIFNSYVSLPEGKSPDWLSLIYHLVIYLPLMIIIDYLYPKFRKYNRYRKSPDGKTHYKWTIFNSYVSLPEGKSPDWLSLIYHLVIYLPLMIIIDYLYPKFMNH